jgi:WD40 repeat protein
LERRSFEFDSVTHRVQLGAPERLVQGRVTSEALSRDGHRLVAELENQRSLVILDPARPQEGRVVEVQAIGADVSLSPDAKLVAIGNWTSSNVTVLDIDSGQPVKLLPAAVCTQGRFSPDGRYLVVGSSEDYQVFKTGSWERVSRLPRQWVAAGKGAIQFSPDSSTVAVLRGQQNYVELWAADTWQELAAFQEGRPLCFSAGGAKLAVYSEEDKMLTVWDLRRVRRQLAALGLDWGTPALPVPGSPGPRARAVARLAGTAP